LATGDTAGIFTKQIQYCRVAGLHTAQCTSMQLYVCRNK